MSARPSRPESDPVSSPALAAHAAEASHTNERVPTDGSVTGVKVAGSLKASGSATSTDEAIRRLGTGSTHAAAGDDSRFPTTGQKNALAGTSGTPASGNEYATKQTTDALDDRLDDVEDGTAWPGGLVLSGSGSSRLRITRTDAAGNAKAAEITANGGGLVIQHDADKMGATFDLLDILHQSTGDGVYVLHRGGHPTVGDLAGNGGNAAFNAQIPYNIDDVNGDGSGSVVNTRQGMRGLIIQSKATANTGEPVLIANWSSCYALVISNQDSSQSPAGVSPGGAVDISDFSAENTIRVKKKTATAANRAALLVKGDYANSGSSSPSVALDVLDSGDFMRARIETNGRLRLFDTAGATKIDLKGADGSAVFGAITAVSLSATGAVNARAASNFDATASNNTSIYGSVNLATTWGIRADGRIGWNGGTPDITLERTVVNSVPRLKTAGSIHATGPVITSKVAAPADADLAAGELAIWFDQTNGAAKVKFKAKEAGGTVRTGEVALA